MTDGSAESNGGPTGQARLAAARDLLAKGLLGEALRTIDSALRADPELSDAWYLSSVIMARAGRWSEATRHVEQAMIGRPEDLGYLVHYAQCLVGEGRAVDALRVVGAPGFTEVSRPDWCDVIGTVYAYAERPEIARGFFEKAAAGAPNDHRILYNLATSQRMMGDLQGAELSLDRVIELDSTDARAHHLRADLRVQTRERNHVEQIREALGAARDAAGRVTLGFALAKELEDVTEYEASFAALDRACVEQRGRMRYDVQDDVNAIDAIIGSHNCGTLIGAGGSEPSGAIFVLGLPRSGTTLVERILGSHRDVHPGGELSAFPEATIQAVRESSARSVDKVEFAARTLEIDPAALGDAYRARTRSLHGQKRRFTDKLPSNYLYAGLISRALPDAPIVALARDPLDSCYAMYKTLFADMYPFSYDLCDLARYYVAWHRLMRHWKGVLGDRMLIVNYEDVVFDQERVTRRMLAHCGLDWDASCLSFHRHVEGVTTASASQVRRPLYASSVGKWRSVEGHLGPLIRYLADHEPVDGWRLS